MDYQKIKELLLKYSYLGTMTTKLNDLEIGWAPNIARKAYLCTIFAPLTDEEMKVIKNEVPYPFPPSYEEFLTQFSNGLFVMLDLFFISGLRRRPHPEEPIAPVTFDSYLYNVLERPKNATNDMLIIGGYSANRSRLYMKQGDPKVYYCEEWDVTPLKSWPSFEEMLIEEITRVSKLFNEETGLLFPAEEFLPVKTS